MKDKLFTVLRLLNSVETHEAHNLNNLLAAIQLVDELLKEVEEQ